MNNQDKLLLHDRYENLKDMSGEFDDATEFITENLKHELRTYQHEAIGRYFHF